MQLREAKKVLKKLANGTHPVTGTSLKDDSPFQHVEVVRAIYKVLEELEEVRVPAEELNKPTRASEPWPNDEDARLKRVYEREVTISQLAKNHGRTEGAIRSRLEKLGLLENKCYDGGIDYSRSRSSGSRLNRDLDRWTGGGSGDHSDRGDAIDLLLD